MRRRYSRSPVRYDQRGGGDHYESSSSNRYSRSRRHSRSRSRSPYYRGGRSSHRGYERRRRSPRAPYRASEEERMRSSTLYLGNLPYQWREPELRRWIETILGVSDVEIKGVSVPMEYDGRKNRGFAFVDFAERADGEKVMAKHTDGTLEADGRRIRCDWDVSLNDRRR